MSGALAGFLQVALLVAALAACCRPLGGYIARVVTAEQDWRAERVIYRAIGVDATADQRWSMYLRSMLAFSAISVLAVYLLERIQGHLFLSNGMSAVPPALAWNTAASFTTNTNWQNYSGETTMGYLAQMSGLAVQNFVSAAAGSAIAVALVRGFLRSRTDRLGNFWVDLTRITIRVLLRSEGELPGAEFVEFTAQARMSGVDTRDGRQVRKGASSAVREWVRESGGALPPELGQLVDGISSVGGTPLVVAEKAGGTARALGAIHLKDIVKEGIRERFAELRTMGIRTVMITGDNPLTARAIAEESGVDDFLAEATPEDKMALIKKEQEGGKLVAMTGDGTNDAPALAQADVGVAMNTGTSAAKEAGNMVDLDSNPKAAYAKLNGVPLADVPPDAATTSGSGLDPYISPQNAADQVNRVATARHRPTAQAQSLVSKYPQGRTIGFLGEPRVNVLLLNIALDAQPKQ